MKKLLALMMMLGLGLFMSPLAGATGAGGYTLDEEAVDQMFASAVEISVHDLEQRALDFPTSGQFSVAEDSKDAIVAWVLCWFLGGVGIHRHYLGTKSNMWALYCFTCGGVFGIVTFVDWVVLLVNGVVNEDLSKYRDNPNFVMWMD